jgi:hypothetical protein
VFTPSTSFSQFASVACLALLGTAELSAAVSAQTELRKIDVPALQREILKRGGVILYENTAKRPEGL